MTLEVQFQGGADVTHINVRKEGQEKEILAIDVKVSGNVRGDVAARLLGCDTWEIDQFWREEADSIVPRFTMMNDFSVASEFDGCEAKIGGRDFFGVKLKKFKFLPIEDKNIRLTMSIGITDLNKNDAAYLCELMNDSADVWAAGQPELFGSDTSEPEDKQADLEDEVMLNMAREAIALMDTVTIGRLKDELRIGYNRAARILEHFEELGLVSTINPNGTRNVLEVAEA